MTVSAPRSRHRQQRPAVPRFAFIRKRELAKMCMKNDGYVNASYSLLMLFKNVITIATDDVLEPSSIFGQRLIMHDNKYLLFLSFL